MRTRAPPEGGGATQKHGCVVLRATGDRLTTGCEKSANAVILNRFAQNDKTGSPRRAADTTRILQLAPVNCPRLCMDFRCVLTRIWSASPTSSIGYPTYSCGHNPHRPRPTDYHAGCRFRHCGCHRQHHRRGHRTHTRRNRRTAFHAWLYFAAWAVGGIYMSIGALQFAELGAMLPLSGGQYNFSRAALGDYAGFIVGWSDWISTAGSFAAVAIVFGEYPRTSCRPLRGIKPCSAGPASRRPSCGRWPRE